MPCEKIQDKDEKGISRFYCHRCQKLWYPSGQMADYVPEKCVEKNAD